jgi:hypothetical protein
MKYYYEFTIDKAPHFLAKRKTNAQVDVVLQEIIPHHTRLICTVKKFEEFETTMYALGFVTSNVLKFKIGADGHKLAKAPVINVK